MLPNLYQKGFSNFAIAKPQYSLVPEVGIESTPSQGSEDF